MRKTYFKKNFKSLGTYLRVLNKVRYLVPV
jgi:hypothetical protein